MNSTSKKAAILHAAGYVGRSLLEAILDHPQLDLVQATSRSFAGQPVGHAHPTLAGKSDLTLVAELDLSTQPDMVFVAAGHGQGAAAVSALRDAGFEGLVVDMSADFRLPDPATYLARYGAEHPRPDLLARAWYGMPELTGPPPSGVDLIANPGCFATALSLALNPLSGLVDGTVAVTAVTGASGSGAQAKATTHFPNRDGNMRAYKVFSHQHEAEIERMAPDVPFSFVPVSGPWTAGIWATLQFQATDPTAVAAAFTARYGDAPLVRLWPDQVPELRWSVGSAFTDIGWSVSGSNVVVGVAIDNLRKGAATQAIQNANLAFGWPETLGLIP